MSSLLRHLVALGAPEPERLDADLMRFGELLVRHNRSRNLIGPLDVDAVAHELLLDALLPALVAPPRAPLLDVGSGAGLPGIPLALLAPELDVHLVEPRLKRTTFCQIAARRLGLQHLHIHRARLEELDALAPGQAHTMAAKAFQPPADWLNTAARWLAPQGLLYLYLSEQSWTAKLDKMAVELGFDEVGRLAHPTRPGRFGLALKKRAT